MSETTLSADAAAPVRLSARTGSPCSLASALFALGLLGVCGIDALGWVATTSVWNDPATALAPVSKAYAALAAEPRAPHLSGALLARPVRGRGGAGRGRETLRARLHCGLRIAYASWFVGAWARLAAVTPAEQAKFGLSWSMKLTSEGGFIVALIAGLVVANFFPLSRHGSPLRPGPNSTSRSPSSFSAPSSP